jgi:hypothetical protein
MCILEINGGNFGPVYQEGSPGNEIASDDLKSPGDQAFAFAYDYSGKIGHLALYRPGTGTFWVRANRDGKSHPVDQEGVPGLGVEGYELTRGALRLFTTKETLGTGSVGMTLNLLLIARSYPTMTKQVKCCAMPSPGCCGPFIYPFLASA